MFKLICGKRNPGGKKTGFSLVELTVVGTIIAILSAIALPVFLNQKQKANDAKAQSDATHMGLFLQSAMRMKPTTATVTSGTEGTTSGDVIIDGVSQPKNGTVPWVSSDGNWCEGALSNTGKAFVANKNKTTTYNAYSMCASATSNPVAISAGVTNYNTVASGLLLYLDAGNTDSYPGSGNNVTDLSGNNATITSYVSPLVVTGGAFDFTASQTDGLNVQANNFTSLSDFTMESVFQTAGTQLHYNGALLSSGDWNLTPGHWSFGINSANTGIVTRNPNFTVNYTFNTNTWYDLVWRRSGTTVTFFVNGAQVAQYTAQSSSIPLTSNASNTAVGRETYANGYFNLNGKIGLTKIYNKALTDAEIASNFKIVKGRFGM